MEKPHFTLKCEKLEARLAKKKYISSEDVDHSGHTVEKALQTMNRVSAALKKIQSCCREISGLQESADIFLTLDYIF
jgi:hypothetical protein